MDVAAAGARSADRWRVAQLPDTLLEPELLQRQRADRADVHRVARVGVVELRAGKDVDVRVDAALEDTQLSRAGDLLREADAPRADDASLGVEHHVRSDRLLLEAFDLFLAEARPPGAVAEGVLLQPALPGLIADRAVERVIGQEELHHGAAAVLDLGARGPHHHPVGGDRRAGGGQLGHLLDLDEADAAVAGDGEPGVIAVPRHIDAGPAGRLQHGGALLDLHFATVDGQLDRVGHPVRASPGSASSPWDSSSG